MRNTTIELAGIACALALMASATQTAEAQQKFVSIGTGGVWATWG